MNLTTRGRTPSHSGPSSVGIIGYTHGELHSVDIANAALFSTLRNTDVQDVCIEIPRDAQVAVDHYLASPRKEHDVENFANLLETHQLFPRGPGENDVIAYKGGIGGLAHEPNFLGMTKTLDTICNAKDGIRVHCVDESYRSDDWQYASDSMKEAAINHKLGSLNADDLRVAERNISMAHAISGIYAPHGLIILTGALHAGHGDQSLDDELSKRDIPTCSVSLSPHVKYQYGAERSSFGDFVTTDADKASSILTASINNHARGSSDNTQESLPDKFEESSCQHLHHQSLSVR